MKDFLRVFEIFEVGLDASKGREDDEKACIKDQQENLSSFKIWCWDNESRENEWTEWWEILSQLIIKQSKAKMTKKQKLYIAKQFKNNDFWVSRVSKKLMMSYSTINSIKIK